MKKLFTVFTILLLFTTLFIQCTFEDGCIDANAINFDASADKQCEDCCNYPQLSLLINRKANDESFNKNTVFYDINNNPFKVQDWKFFLSQVVLLDDSGNEYNIAEEITIPFTNNTEELFSDNFNIIDFSEFSYNIGTISDFGNFSKIKFTVGLENQLQQTDISAFSTTHPLGQNTDSLFIENGGYILNEITIEVDTITKETAIYTIQSPAINVELDNNFVLSEHVNNSISINMDYIKWLEGIDFQNNTYEDIINKITLNTSAAFSIN